MRAGTPPVFVVYREEMDRWFLGDRVLRHAARKLLRPKPTHLSGMQRVVHNFLAGLRSERRSFRFNPPRWAIPRGRKVISFGLGRLGVEGLRPETPIIAAIGFPYPATFPELCERYNVGYFLQHSKWGLDLAKSADIYRGVRWGLWHAGLDTDEWSPAPHSMNKDIDVLVYYKIHWRREYWDKSVTEPVIAEIRRRGLQIRMIRYGCYGPREYKELLRRSKALLFLSPHESQGFAYQECLSCGVPVLAWDPGYWLDPVRFEYGIDFVPTTSVPFFDERCGATFADSEEFLATFGHFYENCLRRCYKPREYVLENLTIANSTRTMLRLYDET